MKKFVLIFIPALICGVVFTSFGSNKTIPKEEGTISEMYKEPEWWQPILQKFNLELGAYNYYESVFGRGLDVFEMGMEGNSINDSVCILRAATVLLRNSSNNTYALFIADSIRHDIKKGIIDFMPIAKKHYQINSDLRETSATHMNVKRFDLTKTSCSYD